MEKVHTIEITMKTAISAVVGFAVLMFGGFWALAAFSVGGIRTDIQGIRTELIAINGANQSTLTNANSTSMDLQKQIAELTSELRSASAAVAGLNSATGGLNATLQSIDAKLTNSINRQQSFEVWVVSQLGKGSLLPSSVPSSWSKGDASVLTSLVTRNASESPIITWFKTLDKGDK